ncbi:hypothetical protein EMIT0P253_60077 [Pseudomonas sp. IT-P253]
MSAASVSNDTPSRAGSLLQGGCKIEGRKKKGLALEAFYFGFNLFNFAASILEKVRT